MWAANTLLPAGGTNVRERAEKVFFAEVTTSKPVRVMEGNREAEEDAPRQPPPRLLLERSTSHGEGDGGEDG